MSCLSRPARKRLALCSFVCVLLTLVDLLLELLRLFFIRETQPSHAVLQLEAVEKRPVLVVLERVVYLLVPNDAAVRG